MIERLVIAALGIARMAQKRRIMSAVTRRMRRRWTRHLDRCWIAVVLPDGQLQLLESGDDAAGNDGKSRIVVLPPAGYSFDHLFVAEK